MSKKPTFGLCLFGNDTAPEFIDKVRRVEDGGFSNIWVADVVLRSRDVFCYMTLAAVHSKTLVVGSAVLHPYTRHVAVAVNALQTLQEIAPGRIVAAWGSGGSGIGELALEPATMRTMRSVAELSHQLDAGRTVSTSAPGLTMVDASLRFPAFTPTPVYFGVTGPRMLQLSGEVADGALAHVGADPACYQYAAAQVQRGAEQRAPSLDTPRVLLYAFLSLTQSGEAIAPGARRGVSSMLSRTRIYAELAGVPRAELAALEAADSLAAIANIASEDTIRRLSISGDAEACADKIARLVDAGVEHITFVPAGADIAGTISVFGERVLPRFL